MPKTIVITGASSGAGRAIALAFAAKQENLVLASRNLEELEKVAEECEELKSLVQVVQTDVTDPGAMINLAALADDFGDGIDVWVNNAGVLAAGSFDETPMEVIDQVLRTNLMGYIHGAHAVLPYFKKQGRGILINNISIGGFLPVPYGVGYSASKFGLRGFSAALKAELTEFPDIHVCDVYPAFLDSPGIQHAANYTGKQLKPAPPVYDPMRLASAVVKIADQPKSETMVGSVSVILKEIYALFPGLTRGIMAKVIRRYLKHAPHIDKTDGNIFNPVDYGNAVHGGWALQDITKTKRKMIAGGGVLLLSAIGLFMLLGKKQGINRFI